MTAETTILLTMAVPLAAALIIPLARHNPNLREAVTLVAALKRDDSGGLPRAATVLLGPVPRGASPHRPGDAAELLISPLRA